MERRLNMMNYKKKVHLFYVLRGSAHNNSLLGSLVSPLVSAEVFGGNVLLCTGSATYWSLRTAKVVELQFALCIYIKHYDPNNDRHSVTLTIGVYTP